ncbi:MAG: LysM peptidoglycan-binding domain-containing protein [bacterium]|nr:LysM peptidoglycan-binding domain-containing protein [bacterium]
MPVRNRPARRLRAHRGPTRTPVRGGWVASTLRTRRVVRPPHPPATAEPPPPATEPVPTKVRKTPSKPGTARPFPFLSPDPDGGTSVLYVVRPGDTLTAVADRFGIPRDRLIRANPEVADPDRIFPGQVLRVPLVQPTLPVVQRAAFEYLVQPGDTLGDIAAAFGVSTGSLRQANPLADPVRLFPGQVLYVPTVADPPPPPVQAILYVVGPGDTLEVIAGRFGVTVGDLRAANPQIADPELIFPGEFVVVPVAGVPLIPVFDLRRYVIQEGDSVESIALQFDVRPQAIGALNPLLAAIPGLILIIPAPIPRPPLPVPPPGFPDCHPAPFGRQLPLGDDDTVFVPFPEDFQFRFFGNIRPRGLWVNSNGNVTFDEGDTTFFPTLDQLVEGPPRIAAFWTDLFTPGAPPTGGVFVDSFADAALNGTRFVVTWDRVPFFFTETPNTVQLLLNPDNSIQICFFGLAPVTEARVFIGVARGEGSVIGNTFLYNAANNPRRLGDPVQPTPQGDLSGRVLLFRFDPVRGNYQLLSG